MTQTAADVQARFYSVSCAGSGSSSITRFESSFFGLFTRLLTRCARISSDGYGIRRSVACSGVPVSQVSTASGGKISGIRCFAL